MGRIGPGLCAVLVLSAIAPQHAAAASYDGRQPFLCAPITIVSCQPGGKCERETTESVDLPRFLKFDIAQNRISGTRPNGEALTAAIGKVDHVAGETILQGVEGDLMWNVMIREEAGDMTLTAGTNKVGFVAFGACTLD